MFISPHSLKYVGNGLCAVPPRKDGTVPEKSRKRPPFCHSDRSGSGVEESTTLEEGLTQDKTCCLGRFLDSLRSLGMTCRGQSHLDSIDESSPLHWVYRVLGNTIQPHRLYLQRGGRQIAAPTCVTPFIHTGYNRNGPGTAHRPFPTVSLIRPFF